MSAPNEIIQLVERYKYNRESYVSNKYNEARLRQEFLNPFFKTLGWDMENAQGYAEAYKEVIHEDSIAVNGKKRAPDYCFRIGGVRKFFVEAKKPSINIRAASDPAYQLRRYAWSAKLPVSILTNFDGFAVYDCRTKPVKTLRSKNPMATAKAALLLYIGHEEYIERWDEIASIFTKEAILKGSFDKYVISKRARHIPVDGHFLAEMNEWRVNLAHAIVRHNPDLTTEQLQDVVQKTIDRIIFLRICEERHIEGFGQLKETNGSYLKLCQIFRRSDERYNSGLFNFSDKSASMVSADTFSLDLSIPTTVLNGIIRSLYDPSPYEFSVFPHDLLGQVYEQFLGKVIIRAGKKSVTVDDKPEVRKSGGVYYTPDHIVRYIVEHTVGKLVEGKSPKQVSSIRILDPACGSGSFLLGAYAYLLDWHVAWYTEDGPERHTSEIYRTETNRWYLTTEEKRRILVDNIYGVDIDSQAVEVARLSLLLKLLEGESETTIDDYKRQHRRKALPDLSENIKCGNSLIENEFYRSEYAQDATEDDRKRVNAFDWGTEFSQTMNEGGFDAVIGNPPYIRIQHMKEWAPLEVEFIKETYETTQKGNIDIYIAFVEKGLSLLKEDGRLGYILPHKFFTANYGAALCDLIARGHRLSKLIHFGHQQVFSGATTYTCLLFLTDAPQTTYELTKVDDISAWISVDEYEQYEIIGPLEGEHPWSFVIGRDTELFNRLKAMPLKLNDVGVTERIFQGVKTGADNIYIVDGIDRSDKGYRIRCPHDGREYLIEPDLLHPLVKGGDGRRYNLLPTNRHVIFPYKSDGSKKASLISSDDLQSQYPLTWKYLCSHMEVLQKREDGKFADSTWWEFSRHQALDVMPRPKIFTPDLAAHVSFSLDDTGEMFFTGGVSGGYGIVASPGISSNFLLGILNSTLMQWFARRRSTEMQGGYISFEARFIKLFPIPTLNESHSSQIDHLCELVAEMLELQHELIGAKTEHEKATNQRRVDAIDDRIDLIVFDLYNLSNEDIEIICTAVTETPHEDK
jgi:type I restriction-modification system DNA methylase subunit